jgi:hypothetical protein
MVAGFLGVYFAPHVIASREPVIEVQGLPVADVTWAQRSVHGLQEGARVVTVRPFKALPDAGWVVVNLDEPGEKGEPEPVTSVRGLAASLARRARRPGFRGVVGAYLRHDATMRNAFYRFAVYPDDLARLDAIAGGEIAPVTS